MHDNLLKIHTEHISYIKELCQVDSCLYDFEIRDFSGEAPYFCKLICPLSKNASCIYGSTHLYGCLESERWCGKYIYYCQAGFIFVANAVLNSDSRLEGGIVSGPILMTNSMDTGECDINIPQPLLKVAPRMSTKKVRYLSETINELCGYAQMCSEKHEQETMQKEQHNTMYYISQLYAQGEQAYPMAYEKQLQSFISSGDKDASQKLLNQLLGHIYFGSNGSFDTVKARIIELVVVLSRATIDAGADIHQIFWLNAKYLDEIKDMNDMEQINRLLSDIIHRFISCVFDFPNIKHIDVLHKVIDYIKEHLCEKITLDEVSEHVNLSKSYLSRIFKEELDTTFTTYINKLRVEKSKSFLLNDNLSLTDIALLTGFDGQSYFTKVFKKEVGVSPGKYRELRGNLTKINTIENKKGDMI